jgi:hypothetical protein
VLIYLIVNSVLTVTWILGGGGFFFPVFRMTAWGAGVVVNAYQAYGPRPD